MQDQQNLQAERLILADLLKEIAAFGRRLREQRAVEALLPSTGAEQTEFIRLEEQVCSL